MALKLLAPKRDTMLRVLHCLQKLLHHEISRYVTAHVSANCLPACAALPHHKFLRLSVSDELCKALVHSTSQVLARGGGGLPEQPVPQRGACSQRGQGLGPAPADGRAVPGLRRQLHAARWYSGSGGYANFH
jgi:hypothetical protein